MIALLVQVALFIALIEAALWCLPREVRRASRANCLRPDGTRSAGRTRVEREAYHRLRLELAAPLLLIFLLGNAAFQTIDQTLTPVPRLVSGMSLGLISAADSTTSSVTLGVWIRVAMLALAWFSVSLLIASWRLWISRRTFSEGVRTRSSEYAQCDITRPKSPASLRRTVPRLSEAGQDKAG